MLKVTKLINKRNRARIQSHLLVTLHRYLLLLICSVLKNTNQNTGKPREEVVLRTAIHNSSLFPLESVMTTTPVPLHYAIFFFSG